MNKLLIEVYMDGYITGIIAGQERTVELYVPGEELTIENPVNDNPLSYVGFVQGYREAIFFKKGVQRT